MVTPMTKTLETKLLWTEDHLTKKGKMKNEGAGLLILGIGALAMGILNHLFLDILYGSDGMWIAVTAVCGLLGIVMAAFGVKMMTKTGSSLAEMTAKDSGCTEREILEFYRECRQPDTLVLSLTPQPTQEKDLANIGFLTKNWLRLPCWVYRVMRITDVAVIWYEETALPGYDPGIFTVKSDGDMYHVKCKADVGKEIVETITGRNAKSITTRCFSFEGRDYDAFQNPKDAAALYQRQ